MKNKEKSPNEANLQKMMESQAPTVVQVDPFVLKYVDPSGESFFVSEDPDAVAAFIKKQKNEKQFES